LSELSSAAPLSFTQKYRFWLFLLLAAIVRQLPIVSIPFKWLESYFHEISHGMAALVSGGSIVQIQLFPNGAGLCTTQGGVAFLISFFGYAGAIIWGTLIYSLAGKHQRMAQLFSAFIILLLVSSMIFWVRDLLTFVIVTVLLVLFVLMHKFEQIKYLQNFMQLIGALVLLNSLFSPLYLVDGRNLGDGASLANLTAIPEIVWVFLWSSLAVCAAVLLGRKT
jgi:hypothetical protein